MALEVITIEAQNNLKEILTEVGRNQLYVIRKLESDYGITIDQVKMARFCNLNWTPQNIDTMIAIARILDTSIEEMFCKDPHTKDFTG